MVEGYVGENEFDRLVNDLDYTLSMVTEPFILNEIEVEVVQSLVQSYLKHAEVVEELEEEIKDLLNQQEHIDWELQEDANHYKEQVEEKEVEIKELKKERGSLRGKITRLEKKLAE